MTTEAISLTAEKINAEWKAKIESKLKDVEYSLDNYTDKDDDDYYNQLVGRLDTLKNLLAENQEENHSPKEQTKPETLDCSVKSQAINKTDITAPADTNIQEVCEDNRINKRVAIWTCHFHGEFKTTQSKAKCPICKSVKVKFIRSEIVPKKAEENKGEMGK